jgi:tRNA nucleotidyltransferase (CCA-adding enzyme)
VSEVSYAKSPSLTLFQFLGLPESPNTEEFQRLWKHRSPTFDYNPITLLSSLLHTPEDALRLHERLKFSAFERDLTYFISQNKQGTKNIDELM